MTISSDDLPLLDPDSESPTVLTPEQDVAGVVGPRAAVACFFPEILGALERTGKRLLDLSSGKPLIEIDYLGERLGVFYPGVGAPLAVASTERVIATGCRAIVACGGAGALMPNLDMGTVVTVTSAVRDEGTSLHYAPPTRDARVDQQAVSVMEEIAESRSIRHIKGKTWTTDALFRETQAKVRRHARDNCILVEMEAAALIVVAQFRDVRFGQFLYAADDVSGVVWRERDWRKATHIRETLFQLAAESALALAASVDARVSGEADRS